MSSTSRTQSVMTALDLLTLAAPPRESWRNAEQKGDDCGRFDSSTASTRTTSPTGSSSADTVETPLAPFDTGLRIMSTSPKVGTGARIGGDASQRVPDASQRVPARRDASERVPDASQRSVRILPSVVRPRPAPLDGVSLRSRGILGDASDRTPPSASGLSWGSMVSSARQAGGASTETTLSQRLRLGHQMGGDASERSLTASSAWSPAMETNRGIWSTSPVGELATPAASCPDASQRSQALAAESPKREVLMAWLSGSGGSLVGIDLAERLTAAAPESYED